MSGSQVYDQRPAAICPCDHCTSGRTRAAVRKHMTLREPMRETKELYVPNAAAVCHCGIDGHPLGSVNCPVHGEKNRREAEEHYAKLAATRTRALAESMPNRDAIAAVVLHESLAGYDSHIKIKATPPDTVYAMVVSNYTKFDLDEDADAYEAAAREEFEPRPIAGCYDYERIAYRAQEIAYNETPMGFTDPIYDVPVAYVRHTPVVRPAGVFNFDAIRYHLNVMHGDDINGTTYLHHTRQGGPRAIRAHDFDPLTQRCTACLWSAQHVLDRIINHCEGRPPKGERCMNCGKPHVVSIQHRGNWMTQCLSCFQGVMTNQPTPDRGALRFEKRMKERAERDYAKGRELQAIEDYINFLPSPLSPEDKAAVQALIDSAHMGGMGVGRIAGPTRAERMAVEHNKALNLAQRVAASEAKNLHPAILKHLAAYEVALRAPRQAVDDAGAPIPPGEPHPEGCVCDVCIPF